MTTNRIELEDEQIQRTRRYRWTPEQQINLPYPLDQSSRAAGSSLLDYVEFTVVGFNGEPWECSWRLHYTARRVLKSGDLGKSFKADFSMYASEALFPGLEDEIEALLAELNGPKP